MIAATDEDRVQRNRNENGYRAIKIGMKIGK